jgi:hypothetical protein
MSSCGKGAAEKAQYWQRTISEAERDVDAGVLPTAPAPRESVLLVARHSASPSDAH